MRYHFWFSFSEIKFDLLMKKLLNDSGTSVADNNNGYMVEFNSLGNTNRPRDIWSLRMGRMS